MITYELLTEEIARAPRRELQAYQGRLVVEFGSGRITEGEYERLDAQYRERMEAPETPAAPALAAVARVVSAARRGVGSRPRTPESLARRRRWAAQGYLPPQLADRFTQGEAAALAIVAREIAARGTCTLALDAIGAQAGVSKTTVKRAMRAARDAGLLTIEERRIDRFNSHTNVVRIISREWSAWIARRARGARVDGGRGQSGSATNTRLLDTSEISSSVPSLGRKTGRVVPFRQGRAG